MTVNFLYGDPIASGVRVHYNIPHVRTIVFDYLYMTLVKYDGLIERYIYDDVANLIVDRKVKE